MACSNAQGAFCQNAAEKLCQKCQQCGNAYQACGLTRTESKESCVEQIKTICAAYDSVFTRETASSCLEQIDALHSCEAFQASGKPEICNKLF